MVRSDAARSSLFPSVLTNDSCNKNVAWFQNYWQPNLAYTAYALVLQGLGSATPVTSAVTEGREDAVLLSYYAAQNKSLFAAQCFVETVLDAYTRGESVDALQTALQLRNVQQNSELLDPTEQDILLSWIIMVMLTAKEVGVALATSSQQQRQSGSDPSISSINTTNSNAAEGITQQFSAQVLGLLQFVKQALKLYFDEGYSLQQLQSLQATVSSDPGQGMSQFAQLMQLYTRLVFITLEVAASSQLPVQRQLSSTTSLKAPSGYTAAFASSSSTTGLITSAALAAGRGGNRGLAVQLMTAFVGAVIGSAYSMRSFVLLTLEAYSEGVPVPEIFQQLQPEEFLQTGGLVPAQQQPQVLQEVNQQLFGRWLSLVYTAAAQLNAVFPGAADKQGWAWYGGEDEVQANAMANFVAQTLLRLQTEEQEALAAGADADRTQEDPLIARIK